MKSNLFASTSILCVTLLAVAGSSARAAEASDGYVIDSRGMPVKSGAGLCWRTGYWSPAMATQDCDPDLAKTKVPDKAPVQKASGKAVSPAAMPAKPEMLSLSADGLFIFGKSALLPESQAKLEAIAAKLKTGKFSKITIVGHTDRLGSTKRKMKLSMERANAVKAFLVSKGVDGAKLVTLGKGSAEPKTAKGQCKGKKTPKLIACLQPDRRVEITVSP